MTGLGSTDLVRAVRKRAAGNPLAKYTMCYLKYRREVIHASTFEIREKFSRWSVKHSDAPSVLFFTVHKCASTFLPNALGYLNRRYLGLRQLDLAGYIWNMKAAPVYEYIQEHSSLIRPTGHIYVPLREYVRVGRLEEFRPIVMVRDPRDVLVSHFYSIAYSHNLPAHPYRRAQFASERERVKTMEVDDYVLEQLNHFRNTFAHYASLADRGAPVLRYEDMILRFDQWLADLGRALGIECDERDLEVLKEMSGAGEKPTGDVFKHVRNRQPGEHNERLSRATISVLDEQFEGILRRLGY